MPANKDQLLRYKVLNSCFKDTSRLYDINALVECCQAEIMRVNGKSICKRKVVFWNRIGRPYMKIEEETFRVDSLVLKIAPYEKSTVAYISAGGNSQTSFTVTIQYNFDLPKCDNQSPFAYAQDHDGM